MAQLLFAVLLTFSKLLHGDCFRYDLMYKNIIGNKNAVCNDGSRAVYYLGVRDSSKWIIFLESGSYCLTREQCKERFGGEDTNILMTSKGMPDVAMGRDLLSTNSQENKMFYSFSRILIPYCSSDSWMGTQTKSMLFNSRHRRATEQFIFSGKIIFQSVILEFLSQFSQEAQQIVFSGSSAGAIAVLNHMQWFKNILSSKNSNVKLSAIVDGGWFINFRESLASKVTPEFFNMSKPMTSACADFSNGYPCCLSAPCMLAQGYYPSDVPTFLVSSMFDIYIIGDVVVREVNRIVFSENGAGDLVTMIDLYGGAMNQSLSAARSPNLSFFVPACFQHTYFSMSSLREEGGVLQYNRKFTQGNAAFSTSKKPGTWLSTAIRGGNRAITLQSTLLKWAQTNQPVRIIDSCLGALCNPTCPDKLTFVDAAVQWSDVLVGLVIFMSLIPTVLCVVLRISFKIQSFLVRRTQKQYEEQKSSETSAWIPVEPVSLQYSAPDCSQHFRSEKITRRFANLEDSKISRGYETLFYGTVQYLRKALGISNKVYPANKTTSQFNDPGYTKVYSEKRDLESQRTVSGSRVERSSESLLGDLRDIEVEALDVPNEITTQDIYNANLTFKDGELVAVVGKNGAGKTTLLQLLCGELTCGCGKGHLTVNGTKLEKLPLNVLVQNFGDESQFSWLACIGELTLKEYLMLYALMTTSENVCNTIKRVEQIICETRLTTVADRTVKGPYRVNLTKLQNHLYSIALQLVSRPLVVLLDEPIAGLDQESSLDMLNILRRVSDRGHLVVVTIQSIPQETAHHFNQLILLSDKQVIYSGSPARLGEHCNPLSEGALGNDTIAVEDIVEDILQNKEIIQVKPLAVGAQSKKAVERDGIQPLEAEKSSFTLQNRETGRFFTRLFVIDFRASFSRDLGERLFLPVVFTLIGLTAGIVYWQTDSPFHIMTAYCGSSIPSLLFLCSFIFNRVTRSLETCRRDFAEKVGYSHEHVTQIFSSITAECIFPVLICSALTYFMVMPSYNWWRFFLATNISLVLNQTWIAVYMVITFVNPRNDCHAGFMVAALAGFASGFVVTRHEMPFGYNFLFYVNPQYYGYSAVTKVLLKDTRLKCDYESVFNCISQDGNAVLAKFDFDSVNPFEHMMMLLVITLLCLLFSWLFCGVRTSR
ncbi:uncharacterized protein [Montipora capricornis]|uniref:uncharacterized protein isoform X1 n=1 Tax=Montipora capricornis TaxID=246305 RepID=UPI0035F112AB